MIVEIVKSLTVSSYQVRDIKTLKVMTVAGDTVWRPGDRVIVSDSLIVGKASDDISQEVVYV